MEKYIINPKYALRHGGNKSYIISRQDNAEITTINIIHPIYAMMLSFFKATTKESAFQQISELLHLSASQVESKIGLLIGNDSPIQAGASSFPPQVIVEYKEGMKIDQYKYSDFLYNDVDLTMSRFDAPIDIICNLTLQCATSCVYCYADRKGNQHKRMGIETLDKIIDEAKKIGVIRFKLMGGEVMLYDGWEHIVHKLIDYGYQPDISIKRPMTEEEIIKWKELKATTNPIQISLDTAIKEHLYQILQVSDPYFEKIIETINLLEKHHVKYIVHTVLNRYNDSIDDIASLVDFFKNRKYLKKWMFDAAKCSMYNSLKYRDYKTSLEKLKPIGEYLQSINKQKIFPFELKSPGIPLNHNKLSKQQKYNLFENRTMCTGNLDAIYILPDGKVTICEELYWHPKFIIGDLTKQSIMEVWNSKKARDMFFLNQSSIPDDSPCSNCPDYTECRKYKHICWRDTLLGYGSEKWYYPDLTCPRAPFITKDIYLE